MAPMGDWMLTEALAARIAEAADAVAAPTLPFGYADYFRPVPGGIALRPESFCGVLEDMCTAFLDHGLDRLVIFNGHSGNYPLIDQTIRRIKRDRGVLIPCLNVWRLIPAEKWREWHGENHAAAVGHGGDPITSVYLHLFPELMRMDLATRGGPKKSMLGLPTSGLNAVKFRGVDINLAVDVTDRCDDGIAGGDPTLSSAETGREIVAYLVDFAVEFIQHFKKVETEITTASNEGGKT